MGLFDTLRKKVSNVVSRISSGISSITSGVKKTTTTISTTVSKTVSGAISSITKRSSQQTPSSSRQPSSSQPSSKPSTYTTSSKGKTSSSTGRRITTSTTPTQTITSQTQTKTQTTTAGKVIGGIKETAKKVAEVSLFPVKVFSSLRQSITSEEYAKRLEEYGKRVGGVAEELSMQVRAFAGGLWRTLTYTPEKGGGYGLIKATREEYAKMKAMEMLSSDIERKKSEIERKKESIERFGSHLEKEYESLERQRLELEKQREILMTRAEVGLATEREISEFNKRIEEYNRKSTEFFTKYTFLYEIPSKKLEKEIEQYNVMAEYLSKNYKKTMEGSAPFPLRFAFEAFTFPVLGPMHYAGKVFEKAPRGEWKEVGKETAIFGGTLLLMEFGGKGLEKAGKFVEKKAIERGIIKPPEVFIKRPSYIAKSEGTVFLEKGAIPKLMRGKAVKGIYSGETFLKYDVKVMKERLPLVKAGDVEVRIPFLSKYKTIKYPISSTGRAVSFFKIKPEAMFREGKSITLLYSLEGRGMGRGVVGVGRNLKDILSKKEKDLGVFFGLSRVNEKGILQTFGIRSRGLGKIRGEFLSLTKFKKEIQPSAATFKEDFISLSKRQLSLFKGRGEIDFLKSVKGEIRTYETLPFKSFGLTKFIGKEKFDFGIFRPKVLKRGAFKSTVSKPKPSILERQKPQYIFTIKPSQIEKSLQARMEKLLSKEIATGLEPMFLVKPKPSILERQKPFGIAVSLKKIETKKVTTIQKPSLLTFRTKTIPLLTPVFKQQQKGLAITLSGLKLIQTQKLGQIEKTKLMKASMPLLEEVAVNPPPPQIVLPPPPPPLVSFPIPPEFFPPIIPPLPKITIAFPSAFKETRLGKQPKKYQPQLVSLIFGIKGKPPKTLTGFEFRPIPSKEKPKSKKLKRKKK